MVTEKWWYLLDYRVAVLQEQGSRTGSASAEEYLRN